KGGQMFGKSSATLLKLPKAPALPPAPAPAPPTVHPPRSGSAPVIPSPAAARKPEPRQDDHSDQWYELKTRIHRNLAEQLDLTIPSQRSGEEVREEVRAAVSGLCQQENALLNVNDRQRLIEEILDETFGLGPLETLLKDPGISDILINGPKQVYIERKGKLQ